MDNSTITTLVILMCALVVMAGCESSGDDGLTADPEEGEEGRGQRKERPEGGFQRDGERRPDGMMDDPALRACAQACRDSGSDREQMRDCMQQCRT